MITEPSEKVKILRISSWKEEASFFLTVTYRGILYNIIEDHTFVSLQVHFNSKLQLVLDAIKIKNYQILNLLKLTSELSALSRNFRTQSPEKVINNLYYKPFKFSFNRQERKLSSSQPFCSLILTLGIY